jgi:UDP-glucose 4-epimerase
MSAAALAPPDRPPQRVLVTGGAGFIGSHVVEAYLGAGHEVLVVDDLSSGRRENLPAGAELHQLDIRSREAARLIVERRIQVLSHHAAQMDVRRSTEDPGFDADVNIRGTLNLLEACVVAGTRHVIFASTGGAIYGDQEVFPAAETHPTRPLSPYGVSKLAGERYLYYYHRQHGLAVTCLRYANVYGERQNPHGEAGVVAIFLQRLLTGGQPVINGDGLQTRDYVHVSDVARANLAALGRDGFRVYNVGTAVETPVTELYELLRGALGSERRPDFGPAKPGEQRRSVIDGALARRELGLPPALELARGLATTAAWFRSRHTT